MNNGRSELLAEVMDEDFVDHGEALFASPRGRSTLEAGIVATHDILPDLYVQLPELIAAGDLVGGVTRVEESAFVVATLAPCFGALFTGIVKRTEDA